MAAGGKRSSRNDPARRDTLLQSHLGRMWRKAASRRSPPPMDRWLAKELSELNGLSRGERLLLGDMLTDAVRFGALAVFANRWAMDRRAPVRDAAARLAAWDAPDGPGLWRELRVLPMPLVFYWSFMRRRSDGTARPPIEAPDERAHSVWKLLHDEAPRGEPRLRALWSGLPPSLLPHLERRAELSSWDATTLGRFLDAQATRPPLWLRARTPDRLDALATELNASGFRAEIHLGALALRGPRGIYEERCWKAGEVDIQDLASQTIGRAVDVQPGQLVWDCCAGAGGKTLQLAADLGGRGAVHATDLNRARLRDLERRVNRAGLETVTVLPWDGRETPEPVAETIAAGGYHRVLVDAPCSGSGTWRRNPDGRLRDLDGGLADLTATQRGLLDRVAPAVRPGGLLVYATCSWLTVEDEDAVDAFLASHPAFVLRRRGLAGNPEANADTTFTAVMERRSDPAM